MSIWMYTLPDKTPPLGKIHLMAIPYFTLAGFVYQFRYRMSLKHSIKPPLTRPVLLNILADFLGTNRCNKQSVIKNFIAKFVKKCFLYKYCDVKWVFDQWWFYVLVKLTPGGSFLNRHSYSKGRMTKVVLILDGNFLKTESIFLLL